MSERDVQDILWKGAIKNGLIDQRIANPEKEPCIASGGSFSSISVEYTQDD